MTKYDNFRSEMRARKMRHHVERITRGIYYGAGIVAGTVLVWAFVVIYMLVFTD